MTFRRFSRKDLLSGTAEVGPGDGLDPRLDRRGQDGRELGRKTLQLCGQVARTLMGVLPCSAEEVLRDLEVIGVTPAGSGRLLVTLGRLPSAPAVASAVLLDHLARAHGWLRNEVSAAVHRRKAPDLIFRVVEDTDKA
jgi:ribosome-binding factor A